MARRPKQEPSFATEAALCARFIALVREGWVAYAETGGWDILLVRTEDGFQIGIEAKLRLNTEVISQALEDGYYGDRAGPDCRAVLVPDGAEAPHLHRICAYVGLTVIRVRPEGKEYGIAFFPYLPRIDYARSLDDDWFELCPLRRHVLPDYVPDVAAGASAPVQLTAWKIAAIKIAVTLEKRGYVTRHDFKAYGLDHRRWTARENGWLQPREGVYVAGDRLPDLRGQHPRVYEEIAAEAEKWMAPAPLLVAPQPAVPVGSEGAS